MTNGIIIRGIAYKAVRHQYYGLPLGYDVCAKCDLYKQCEKEDAQPCVIFNRAHCLVNFKKVKK